MAQPEVQTKKKPRGKIFYGVIISLLVVFAIVFVFISRHRAQTAACIEVWLELGNQREQLSVAPRQLPDTSVSSAATTVIQQNGHEFQFSWQGMVSSKVLKNIGRYSFSNGINVVIEFPPPQSSRMVLLRQRFTTEPEDQIQEALGPELMKSKSNLYMAMMNANIKDVSIFMPRQDAERDIFLLPLKAIEYVPFKKSVYVVDLPGVQGMQIGDPVLHQSPLLLDVFDAQDTEIKVRVAVKAGAEYQVTQPEINAVLQSIHSVAGR